MARRWRALHKRRARKLALSVQDYERWRPTGWEVVYSRDCDDDDDPYEYDEDYDGDCFHCGGDGWIDGYDDDPLWFSPGELTRCSSCNGSGRAKDMTIW